MAKDCFGIIFLSEGIKDLTCEVISKTSYSYLNPCLMLRMHRFKSILIGIYISIHIYICFVWNHKNRSSTLYIVGFWCLGEETILSKCFVNINEIPNIPILPSFCLNMILHKLFQMINDTSILYFLQVSPNLMLDRSKLLLPERNPGTFPLSPEQRHARTNIVNVMGLSMFPSAM